jgi:cytochrome b6-f complex iron-sulfur subunit
MDGPTETIEQHTDPTRRDMPRRGVLCGLAVLGLGLPAGVSLAGCSTTTEPANTGNGGDTGAQPTASGGADGGGDSNTLIALDEVPDGGGKVIEGGETPILVVRDGDTVKAFNASCTHQGTTVNPPEDGTITCPNHGSQFNASDGSVEQGPAQNALEEVGVSVQDGQVVKS